MMHVSHAWSQGFEDARKERAALESRLQDLSDQVMKTPAPTPAAPAPQQQRGLEGAQVSSSSSSTHEQQQQQLAKDVGMLQSAVRRVEQTLSQVQQQHTQHAQRVQEQHSQQVSEVQQSLAQLKEGTKEHADGAQDEHVRVEVEQLRRGVQELQEHRQQVCFGGGGVCVRVGVGG